MKPYGLIELLKDIMETPSVEVIVLPRADYNRVRADIVADRKQSGYWIEVATSIGLTLRVHGVAIKVLETDHRPQGFSTGRAPHGAWTGTGAWQ
jgi:hypothetical protein